MPRKVDTRFFRCRSHLPRKVGLVIPPNAVMRANVAETMRQRGLPIEPPTVLPHKFSFHYLDQPFPRELLEDGATVDTGVYEFLVRDGVLAVFEQPFSSINEFCWSFSTTAQIDVLAALRVGETLDVEFDQQLLVAEHVIKSSFPCGQPDTDYGTYAFHAQVDNLSGLGFRIVSSFEPSSRQTSSRLPFFMGFRVFGRKQLDFELPLWREALGQAVREALLERWEHAVLFSAFALESFIDGQLAEHLSHAGLGEEYSEHVLRVTERKFELHALNTVSKRLSPRAVNREYNQLNRAVFTPRNKLAHGVRRASEFTEAVAVEAIRSVVRFMWDSNRTQRHLLLPEVPVHDVTMLIDEELRAACVSET